MCSLDGPSENMYAAIPTSEPHQAVSEGLSGLLALLGYSERKRERVREKKNLYLGTTSAVTASEDLRGLLALLGSSESLRRLVGWSWAMGFTREEEESVEYISKILPLCLKIQ